MTNPAIHRLHRRPAWVIGLCLLMLMNMSMPLATALGAGAADDGWVTICTGDGFRQVRLATLLASDDDGSAPQSCPLCPDTPGCHSMGAAPAPPPAGGDGGGIRRPFDDPRPPIAPAAEVSDWPVPSQARPRAPPVLS
ncbi:hypothetical protein [Arhodomonas aquaeolei]|uniref:hypothetical protein n=1 Tax=Arhodomonas aquaeolei TaxID=2369 RepID=UPI000366CD77|nr:hypothetical protein [Arhodomonas aquaeolei]